MVQGKISQNVLKRSVLNRIKKHGNDILSSAGLGVDCAILSCKDENMAIATDTVTYTQENLGTCSFYRVLNDLAASGCTPIGIVVDILMQEEDTEEHLRDIMDQLEAGCASRHMQILGGHTCVSNAVTRTVVSLTGVGKADSAVQLSVKRIKPGYDIVMTKQIATEGTVLLAKEHETELLDRLPKSFIQKAAELERDLSCLPEVKIALKQNVVFLHDVSEGGIFAALSDLSERIGMGLSVDLKKIPVRQETVEICEFFGLNPYQLLSSGAMLMITEDGKTLVKALEEAQISACLIGRVTENHDKIVINEDEVRYLDLPKPDEIYQLTK